MERTRTCISICVSLASIAARKPWKGRLPLKSPIRDKHRSREHIEIAVRPDGDAMVCWIYARRYARCVLPLPGMSVSIGVSSRLACSARFPDDVRRPRLQLRLYAEPPVGQFWTSTPSVETTPSHQQKGQRLNTLPARGVYGHPDEIAELMAFLVSPAAKWMTGSALRMDGGEVKSV
jgi:hypothetical protein